MRDAYQFNELGQVRAAWGDPSTPNPSYGAIFTYHVGKAPAGDAKLVLNITDAAGKPVRRLDLTGQPGVHRIAWNLRGEAPQGAGAQGGRGGGRGGGQQGEPVEPGRYRATIARVAGDTVTPIGEGQTFHVIPLPR